MGQQQSIYLVLAKKTCVQCIEPIIETLFNYVIYMHFNLIHSIEYFVN